MARKEGVIYLADHALAAEIACQVEWLELVDDVTELDLAALADQINVEPGVLAGGGGRGEILVWDIFNVHLNYVLMLFF